MVRNEIIDKSVFHKRQFSKNEENQKQILITYLSDCLRMPRNGQESKDKASLFADHPKKTV